MSAVAVTGAAGFIGRAMCRRLVAEGHEVIGIDVDPGPLEAQVLGDRVPRRVRLHEHHPVPREARYRAQLDGPAALLGRWEVDKVFARTLEASAGRPQWNFYEGPPTANGRPGTHHIEARAFKDVFHRFKTMQGWHVPRRAGWDCHGLPVEIAVEQELGFAGKPDIERYGIAE
ncbi:MAG TPA: class I tRNA ligase family protein, partial [Thermoleophilaceae bacterium]|nr:class I tRNA ligase family protein [Thermoleophilaceae bacterium]